MIPLSPFERFVQPADGIPVPLPPEIESIYGLLTFPPPTERPLVISNFVTTLDGVVSLAVPGKEGGRAISGDNRHDRLLVATLCAVADAIVIGGATLRTSSGHIWTASGIAPEYDEPFAALRQSLGKVNPPLNVVVSGHGNIDPTERMFQTGEVPTLVVTTAQGASHVRKLGLSPSVSIAVTDAGPDISPQAVLDAIADTQPANLILLEAGPHLTTAFMAARLIDELFLTLAPQIAGRDPTTPRLALAEGHAFAPDDPLWGTLIDVRRAGSHLFLRYTLAGIE